MESSFPIQGLTWYFCEKCSGVGYFHINCLTCEASIFCNKCYGKGIISKKCDTCEGKGKFDDSISCQDCEGTGFISSKKCETCKGMRKIYPFCSDNVETIECDHCDGKGIVYISK